MNKDKFVPGVMLRTECKKHGALLGLPCWDIHTDRYILPAICDARARRSGCNGRINPESMGRTRSQRGR